MALNITFTSDPSNYSGSESRKSPRESELFIGKPNTTSSVSDTGTITGNGINIIENVIGCVSIISGLGTKTVTVATAIALGASDQLGVEIIGHA